MRFDVDGTLLEVLANSGACGRHGLHGMRSTRRLELGGDPPATVASQLCGLPTLFVRKEANVIDQEAGGAENLAAEGLELRSLFTMSQLR